MLEFTLKNRKSPFIPTYPKPAVVPINNNVHQVNGGGSWGEVMRRDKLIKKLALDSNLSVGQVVLPIHADDETKYGECVLIGIAKTYTEYGKDMDWPKNDNPMILTLTTSTGETIFATTNYVKAK